VRTTGRFALFVSVISNGCSRAGASFAQKTTQHGDLYAAVVLLPASRPGNLSATVVSTSGREVVGVSDHESSRSPEHGTGTRRTAKFWNSHSSDRVVRRISAVLD